MDKEEMVGDCDGEMEMEQAGDVSQVSKRNAVINVTMYMLGFRRV